MEHHTWWTKKRSHPTLNCEFRGTQLPQIINDKSHRPPIPVTHPYFFRTSDTSLIITPLRKLIYKSLLFLFPFFRLCRRDLDLGRGSRRWFRCYAAWSLCHWWELISTGWMRLWTRSTGIDTGWICRQGIRVHFGMGSGYRCGSWVFEVVWCNEICNRYPSGIKFRWRNRLKSYWW